MIGCRLRVILANILLFTYGAIHDKGKRTLYCTLNRAVTATHSCYGRT